MTVLVSDSFNRADSATTLGTTDSYAGGTATAWTVVGAGSPVYGINSNQAYQASGSSWDWQYAYIDKGVANTKITATFSNISSYPNLVLRASDANNYLQLVTGAVGSPYILYKLDSGANYTEISRGGTSANGDVIVVTLNGSSITVTRNGTNIITTTSTFNQTATRFGFNLQFAPANRVDNFILEDFTTGGTGTTYTGSGASQGISTLSQPEKLIYKASGTVQGTSNVSSVEKSILKALGTLQGSSSLTSSETYTTQTGTTYTGGGTLQGSSIVSGNEHYLYKASGTLQGLSNLSSGETLILFTGNTYSSSGTIQGFSTLSASEKIIYKEISTAVGYSDSSVHEIVTLLASGISQGYSNVLLIDKTEVIAQVSLIGKQRIEVTLIGKQKIDANMQGKQRITINLKGVMK